jgi:hypothetical protein
MKSMSDIALAAILGIVLTLTVQAATDHRTVMTYLHTHCELTKR